MENSPKNDYDFSSSFNKYLISNKQVPGDSVEAMGGGGEPGNISHDNFLPKWLYDGPKNFSYLIIKLSKDWVYSLRA